MDTKWSFIWNRLRSIWTIPDLRNKILFTLGLLLVTRVLAYITVSLSPPGTGQPGSSFREWPE